MGHSLDFALFMESNGIKHINCAPYHPSSNGAVEQFNETFKQTLRAGKMDGKTLSHRLADFLLTYHSTPHATTNRTPSSLFLQKELRTGFSLIHSDVSKHVHEKQADQITKHNQHTTSLPLSSPFTVLSNSSLSLPQSRVDSHLVC